MKKLRTITTGALFAGSVLGINAVCPAQETPAPPATKPADSAPKSDKSKAKPPVPKKKPAAPGDAKPGDQKKGDEPEKPATPPGDAKPGDEGKGAKPADGQEKPAESEGPDADTFKDIEVHRPTLIEPGYSNWGLSGSQNKFRQYATPPEGFFIRDFRLRPIHPPAGTDMFLGLKSIGQPDWANDARIGLWYGNTRLSGTMTRNSFFDPTPSLIPESDRRVDRAIIRQQLWKDFSLSFAYRKDELNKSYQEPTQPVFVNTRYRDLIAGGRLGNGYASLKLLEWDFASHPGADRRDILDQTKTRALTLGYLWNATPTIGLEGAYTRTWINQPALLTARLDALSLDGDVAIGANTSLDLFLRQQHVQTPIVQNAFVRDQRSGALRIDHRFKGWTAQAGIRLQEAEMVRGDHTYVDVPRWSTFDAKLTGRMFRIARVSLRGSTQSLQNAPISSLTDTRTLYWTSRDTAQLKVDLAPSPYVTAYGQWGYRHWRNSQRFTNLTNHNLTFGGDWQATPNLDFFIEYTRDMWGGHGEDQSYPSLVNFVPDSQVSAFGLNWSFGPRAVVSLTYSDFSTVSNDNPLLLREGNTHGSFLTINAHYHFPRGYELGLIVAPWTFRDQVVPTQDYNTSIVMITGAARF